MPNNTGKHFPDFYIAGINYKKSDTLTRGSYSVNPHQYLELIKNAQAAGLTQFFVLSTCNRTEIYGLVENVEELTSLLCSVTEGNHETFQAISYHKKNNAAIEHFFNVAAGLDSQILGDYEIIGQIKQAARISKEQNCLGVFLDRLVNEVLQASKKIRTHTALSSGTVSVSFAAIQFIKQHFLAPLNKNILLIGAGKIGSNTLKNIMDYLPGNNITLINRNEEKAMALANQYQLRHDVIENLYNCLQQADIIIVATSAEEPIIRRQHILPNATSLFIDLSVPFNIDPDIENLSGITLVNVDELSKLKDDTLQKRKAEIPKAQILIREHLEAFEEWLIMRRYVPVLKKVKSHLQNISGTPLLEEEKMIPLSSIGITPAEQKIQKALNGMAVKMRIKNQPGCHCIEAINDFINASLN